MRIAFIGSPTSWYLRDLQRAAAGRHEIVPVSFDALASQVAGGEIVVSCSPPPSKGGARGGTGRRYEHNTLPEPPRLAQPLPSGERSLNDQFDVVLVRTMPPASLEQVVFRMDALAQLEAAGVRVVNPAKAIEAAVDKYLTTARLARAGLPVPRTLTCQTAEAAMQAFADLGGDAVVKPLFGGEGRGITRVGDEALALRAFRMLEQLGAVIYLQEFIPHDGSDVRLLMIGDRTLAIRRRNHDDWRTNIARGGVAEPYEPTDEVVELARRATTAVGAELVGVDLLQRPDGAWCVLEVNAVPGWQATAQATCVDVAQLVLEFLVTPRH